MEAEAKKQSIDAQKGEKPKCDQMLPGTSTEQRAGEKKYL